MNQIDFINPETLVRPGHYSHVARAGGFVWLSGQTSVDRDGSIVGRGDAGVQALQVWRNVETALQAIGGSLQDIIKTDIFIVGRDSLQGVVDAYGRLEEEHNLSSLPASTLVIVKGLARPELLVEMDVVAAVDL